MQPKVCWLPKETAKNENQLRIRLQLVRTNISTPRDSSTLRKTPRIGMQPLWIPSKAKVSQPSSAVQPLKKKSVEATGILLLEYTLAVGNTPYGKRHTSRTISMKPLQSILEESLHSRPSFGTTDRSIQRILQREKRLRDERYKYHSANLKNVRVPALPILFNIELRWQCQPLTFRPMPASNRLYSTNDAT